MANETVFTKIDQGIIPSVKIYNDDKCFVIMDINPVVKGHCLVISKEVRPTLTDAPEDLVQHMILVARKIDARLREVLKCDGTNIMINNGPASGQEVPHLHIHVIPRYENDGRKAGFAHDSYADGEMAELGRRLEIK